MSSILTNNGAMVALQTLQNINKSLGQTQSEISTGKSVGSAKDNAAVWAISKQMESDVQGFKAIKESLALGESTVAVARNASETVTDLLTQIKGKIVASQEDNVDRSKIQADIVALRDQIGAVVGAAQFNGLNLLSNKETDAGSGSVDILASLDRSASGVSSSSISVGKQDLGVEASSINGTPTALATAANNVTGEGDAAAFAIAGNATTRNDAVFEIGTTAADGVEAGQGYAITISAGAGAFGGTALNTTDLNDIKYVARDGDTRADVAQGLADSFNEYIKEKGFEDTGVQATVTDAGEVTVVGALVAADGFSIAVNSYGSDDTTIGGGLEKLSGIDVSSEAGSEAALDQIEGLIQTAIDSSAAFGSSQGRIETQSDFISKLSDSLKSGIGSLVDANMEEASARLQALQVQQQLATQSLSIANQAPQSILALFR
ncbi:flagellin [Jannaschia aquimarina]|uniref:Flagellin n=1 Tax=Jannaschia aquimarina TaxID=935700 RepID=A0A0D1EEK3_9RHOB|nr:flagellin [Jannaschia aquimarina]KIT15301.1 Flagellin [Jannaschia aquimarina]SNS50760.1 flagellin [Jannaschia aquimarina]